MSGFMHNLMFFLPVFFAMSCVSIGNAKRPLNLEYVICTKDDSKYSQRSVELQGIVDADQADRVGGVTLPGTVFRDRERRQRVGQIFGEGCFKSAKDYSNAALVFQHGDKPDHYLQTFLWSKRSAALGDKSQMRMMALSIDRYLISKGHKQLFASQVFKSNDSPCWCLQQVEETFPAEMRKKYMKATLENQSSWIDEMNEQEESCPSPNYCSVDLKDSPRGTIPGFW